MKGLFIFITFLFSAICSAQSFSAHDEPSIKPVKKILVLKSKDSNYYDQTIQFLNNALADNYSLRITNIKDKPQQDSEKIIISLGFRAAQFSRTNFQNSDKIFAFLTLQQSNAIGLNAHETHLLIEQSPQLYLKFAHILLPTKKISMLVQDWQNKFISAYKNKAIFVEVGKRNDVISATKWAIKNSDLLLAIPNRTIYNRYSLKGILLSTYQSSTPLISYSPAHVKAGALAAIYASPSNLAQKIVDAIKSSSLPSKHIPSRQFAQYYTFKINRRVAQSLSLNLISDEEIALKLKEKIIDE